MGVGEGDMCTHTHTQVHTFVCMCLHALVIHIVPHKAPLRYRRNTYPLHYNNELEPSLLIHSDLTHTLHTNTHLTGNEYSTS